MNGTKIKDHVTGVTTIDTETSVIRMLKNCSDFKNERTQMGYILESLGVKL